MEQRMERRWSCLRDWLGKPGDWRLGGAEGGQWERGQVIEMRMRLRMRMRKSIPMTFTLAVLEDESPLLWTKKT